MAGLIKCKACGGTVSAQASACPHCGQPQTKNASPAAALGVIVGGALITWGAMKVVQSPSFNPSSAPVPQVVIGGPQIVPRVEMPSGPTPADRAKAKAQYDADVAMLRKRKPKTEADTTKLIGRKPDNVMTAGPNTYVHWYYETKEIGRDVLSIATDQSGKIIVSDF